MSRTHAKTLTQVVQEEREAKRRPLDLKLILRLMEYTKPYAWKRNLLFFLCSLRAVQVTAMTYAIYWVITGPIINKDVAGVIWGAVGIVALAIFTEVTFHFRMRFALELGESVIHDLRRDIFDKIQQMTMTQFDRTKVGRLISRMTSDSEAVRRGIQDVVFVSLVQGGQTIVAGGGDVVPGLEAVSGGAVRGAGVVADRDVLPAAVVGVLPPGAGELFEGDGDAGGVGERDSRDAGVRSAGCECGPV